MPCVGQPPLHTAVVPVAALAQSGKWHLNGVSTPAKALDALPYKTAIAWQMGNR